MRCFSCMLPNFQQFYKSCFSFSLFFCHYFTYRIFSIKCRTPIKRRLRINTGCVLSGPQRLIGVPAFIMGQGHNGTVTTYQDMLFWYFNKRSKEKYRRNITGIVAAKQNKTLAMYLCSCCIIDALSLFILYFFFLYVLFVSDTNLDCNMVHMLYLRYHNTVTSSNPGKNRPALTNCP